MLVSLFLFLIRMWSTSATWSVATSSAVDSTAARSPVTVETVDSACSPVSPAVHFQCSSPVFITQKYILVSFPFPLSLCSMVLPQSTYDVPVSPFAGFDELTCHCGVTVLYPPIACGTKPPECKNLCTRRHECDHPGEVKLYVFARH